MSGWQARLELEFRRDGAATRSRDRHVGPLRVLQPLYPEGPAICHQVLVHPPGGLVGGDTVELDVRVGAGAHALITTPGATRWYRSEGEPARQSVRLSLASGSRLEWLPLESIAHSGCLAESRLQAALAPGAEMMGWDLLALGLPASAQPFDAGCYRQHLEIEGLWLERAAIAASDRALLDAAPGWAGRRVLATLWFAAGAAIEAPRRERLLEAARAGVAAHPLAACAGASSPQPALLVLRVLAPGVEPALSLLAAVRAAWRRAAWDLAAPAPRTWST